MLGWIPYHRITGNLHYRSHLDQKHQSLLQLIDKMLCSLMRKKIQFVKADKPGLGFGNLLQQQRLVYSTQYRLESAAVDTGTCYESSRWHNIASIYNL